MKRSSRGAPAADRVGALVVIHLVAASVSAEGVRRLGSEFGGVEVGVCEHDAAPLGKMPIGAPIAIER